MGVEAEGFPAAYAKLSKMDKRIAERARREGVQREATHLAARARSEGTIGSQKLAAATVRSHATALGAEVSGGAGGGVGAAVFKGAEFGARGRKYGTYVRRSNRGRGGPGIVRRRTTRQFPPFVGRTGYFYWPSLREGIKGMGTRIQREIDKEIAANG